MKSKGSWLLESDAKPLLISKFNKSVHYGFIRCFNWI